MDDRDISDYCTVGLTVVIDELNVRLDTACGTDHDQQSLSKSMI